MVTGTTINENFTSNDLLGWVGQGLAADGVIDKSNESNVIKSGEEPVVKFAGENLKVTSYSSGLKIAQVEDNGFNNVTVEVSPKDDGSLDGRVLLGSSDPLNSVQTEKVNTYLDSAKPDGAEIGDITAGDNDYGVSHGKSVKFSAANADEFSAKLQKLLGSDENKLEINSSVNSSDSTALVTTYSGILDCVAVCSPSGNGPTFKAKMTDGWQSYYPSDSSSSNNQSNNSVTTRSFSTSYKRQIQLKSADVKVDLKSGTGAKATFTYGVSTDDAKLVGDGLKQMLAPADDKGSFEESEKDGETTYTAVIEGKDQDEFNSKLSSYIPESSLSVTRPQGLKIWPEYTVTLQLPVVDEKLKNLEGKYSFEVTPATFNSFVTDKTYSTMNVEKKSLSFNQDSFGYSDASSATSYIAATAKGPTTFGLIFLIILILLVLVLIAVIVFFRKQILAKLNEIQNKRQEAAAAQPQHTTATPYNPNTAYPGATYPGATNNPYPQAGSQDAHSYPVPPQQNSAPQYSAQPQPPVPPAPSEAQQPSAPTQQSATNNTPYPPAPEQNPGNGNS